MKWSHPKHGDTRKRSGFLYFPTKIAYETRWLCFAIWKEEFCSWPGSWVKKEWIDVPDIKEQ